MITLPFSAIPHTSNLFDDYCSGLPNAKQFYIGHFSDLMAYETHLQILETRSYNREHLCSVLERQNQKFLSGQKTFSNISLLRDPRTFAVVTGQQVGIFTGPLYTLYKALTAVHLTSWLKAQFPAYQFVPMFWLEGEDHDIEEVSVVGIVNKDNDFVRLRYGKPLEEGEKNYQSVGSKSFDDSIKNVIASMIDSSAETDFTSKVMNTFSAAYCEGVSFTHAFACLMNSLFPQHGIIIIDPSDHEIKKNLSQVFLHELETFPSSGEEIIQRSAELEDLYHAQVKPRAINLFYFNKGGRYAVEPGENDFWLRGTRQRFQRDELRSLAQTSPELFSPNVLLRPIVQDYLLPTIAYVAGPAEVSYFAQLQPVYDHFKVPMPIVFPRASITLIEPKIQKLFDKFNIEFTSMFLTPDEIYKIITKNDSEEGTVELETFANELDQWQSRLKTLAEKIDVSHIDAAETTISKMKSHLSVFERKLFQSKKQKDQVIHRQLEKMQMYLNPTGVMQERQINIFTFLNRYGFEILDLMSKSCEPFPAEHRIMHIL